MWELLRQVHPGDLTTILGVALAFALVCLIVTVRVVATTRRSRDRRLLIALVLEMLERDVAPEDVMAVLRAMGLQRFDDRFSTVRRRLFRRYARRRAATRARATAPTQPPAERELQAVG